MVGSWISGWWFLVCGDLVLGVGVWLPCVGLFGFGLFGLGLMSMVSLGWVRLLVFLGADVVCCF